MGLLLADTTLHRPRFVWLAVVLAATITMFALHHSHQHDRRHAPIQLQRIGHCIEQIKVHSYYR